MATWKSNSYIVIGWKISHIIQDIIIGKCRPIITYSVNDISTTQHLVIFPNLGGNRTVGERPLHIKGRSFLISTFPCASTMWDSIDYKTPHFWVSTIHPPYKHTQPQVWGPHFRLGHSSDTIYNDSIPIGLRIYLVRCFGISKFIIVFLKFKILFCNSNFL